MSDETTSLIRGNTDNVPRGQTEPPAVMAGGPGFVRHRWTWLVYPRGFLNLDEASGAKRGNAGHRQVSGNPAVLAGGRPAVR